MPSGHYYSVKNMEYRGYVADVLESTPYQNVFKHGSNFKSLFGSDRFNSRVLAVGLCADWCERHGLQLWKQGPGYIFTKFFQLTRPNGKGMVRINYSWNIYTNIAYLEIFWWETLIKLNEKCQSQFSMATYCLSWPGT